MITVSHLLLMQANSSYPRGPSAWGAYEEPLAFVAGFLGWFAPSNIKVGGSLNRSSLATCDLQCGCLGSVPWAGSHPLTSRWAAV